MRSMGCAVLLLLTVVCLAGCEESNQTSNAPAQKKTNEFETGRFALQKMLPSARLWAPDAEPIQLESSATSHDNGQGGKSANWRVVFGSRSRGKSEPFTWSGMADAQTKVDHGVEDTFNPNNRSTQPFDLNFLKIDTDQAYDVAQKHGGKEVTEKDPKTQVTYLLVWNAQAGELEWHVMYADHTRLTVLVDASSARYLRKE
ncbi:MAG TPA: hypothetical protein VJN64_02205 [Terriglobales bacterium]|nr:hypothetical protein [Terriglobales bacterium]